MAYSAAAQRIISAAITHFAQWGYESASLADIADAVGIRKASIYTHFSSKDELFTAAFDQALQTEIAFANSCFLSEEEDQLPGAKYCESLIERYAQSEHLRLFLRTSYIAPPSLDMFISQAHEQYLTQLSVGFSHRLQALLTLRGISKVVEVEYYSHAYLGIVDSLQVKLIYTDKANASIRLVAMQNMLRDALFALDS